MSAHKYLSSSLLCLFMLSGLLFFSTVAGARRRRTMIGCTTLERDALVDYKSGIIDTYGRLSSWTIDQDCCRWSGVVCYNQTTSGQVHVVQLNLQNPSDDYESAFQYGILKGEMLSSSLLSLTHLEGLNLTLNDLRGIQIPYLVGSLHKLRYLDLCSSKFGGKIPHHLGNLSNLRYLNLGSEWEFSYADRHSLEFGSYAVEVGSYADSLDWLLGLSYLTYLDMSNVNLSTVSQHWLTVMNALPPLQELRLSGCHLNHLPSSLSHPNLTALNSLFLGSNYFNSTLPNWLWNLTTLSTLHLSNAQIYGTISIGIGNLANLMLLYLARNSLSGPLPAEFWSLARLKVLSLKRNYLFGGHIPNEIGNLSSLSGIWLSHCSFVGPIPAEIGNLTSLEILKLGDNSLTSSIPLEINKLSNLEDINLSRNSLEGVLSQLHFSNSTRLQSLRLSDNHLLNIAIDETWVPPFQLHDILLDSCKLGPSFPRWIRSQQTIEYLYFSNTSIEDALPEWFWNLSSSTLSKLDLSQNKITGALPSSFENMERLVFLDLHNNLLEGSVPQLSPNMSVVDLSNNHIVGSIPLSICLSYQLQAIALSNNLISGQIPSCNWQAAEYLIFIHLGNNKLTGEIPSSLGSLTGIRSLHLNNNNLHGRIPSSLQNCSRLHLFDLGGNNFSEQIPEWIGQSWRELTILRLHSNMFYGNIPPQLGQLRKLQIIDLANNRLVGPIPCSLGNLSAIISTSTVMDSTYITSPVEIIKVNEEITSNMKGREFQISIILYLFKSIDLSNNRLSGEIPEELGSLGGLQTLNLSRNYFTGKIPKTIDGMKALETLDLSFNNLSGAIPQGLTMLSSLNHLNLSYNNLSGTIPTGNQLQTLGDGPIYIGNPYLCGVTTINSCFPINNNNVMDEVASNLMSNYLPATLGFFVGLWSVFVIILFKKDWRHFYFGVIDKVYDKTYVAIKIRMKRK